MSGFGILQALWEIVEWQPPRSFGTFGFDRFVKSLADFKSLEETLADLMAKGRVTVTGMPGAFCGPMRARVQLKVHYYWYTILSKESCSV